MRWERSAADAEAPLGGETLFADAKRAVGAGLRKLCTLLGERVAFTDLKPLLGDRIYLPTPSASDLRPVLVELDQKLLPAVVGAVGCADADAQALRSLVVAEIFAACVRALLAAILSGRPRRSFAPSDEAIVDHDLFQLQELFRAAARRARPPASPRALSALVAWSGDAAPLRRLLPTARRLVRRARHVDREGGRAGAAARPSASLDVHRAPRCRGRGWPTEQQQPTEAQLEALEQQQQQQRVTQVLLSRSDDAAARWKGSHARTWLGGAASNCSRLLSVRVCDVYSVRYNRFFIAGRAWTPKRECEAAAGPADRVAAATRGRISTTAAPLKPTCTVRRAASASDASALSVLCTAIASAAVAARRRPLP